MKKTRLISHGRAASNLNGSFLYSRIIIIAGSVALDPIDLFKLIWRGNFIQCDQDVMDVCMTPTKLPIKFVDCSFQAWRSKLWLCLLRCPMQICHLPNGKWIASEALSHQTSRAFLRICFSVRRVLRLWVSWAFAAQHELCTEPICAELVIAQWSRLVKLIL